MARVTYRNKHQMSNGPQGIAWMAGGFCERFRCKICAEAGRHGQLESFINADGYSRVYCPTCDRGKPMAERNVFLRVRHWASIETERVHALLESEPDPVAAGVMDEGRSLLRDADEEANWL